MTRIHRRLFLQQSAAVGTALLVKPVHAANVNEKLNIGLIGCGDRSNALLPAFKKLSDVRIAALCDADEQRLNEAAEKTPGATKYVDLRKLLEDKNIDAVAIATCNHWHALAAIWAMKAGKDVYVEKPLSHSHWEGQQVVNASRKLDRIVQLGTQQRSDPVQAELKEYLHDKKELGQIKYVQVCRFGTRDPIGKRSTPLEPPKTVNYDLWLGPAQDQPIYRSRFHYDWHWDWNTGNGELGNWGVHVLDDAINVALRDECGIPKRMAAAGGRVLWDDAGDTPNVYFAYYDTGSVPVLFGLSNLTDGPNAKDSLKVDRIGSGYIVHCENGYYAGGRGGGASYDLNGKEIRKFKGDQGARHQRNFVDSVFAHDRSKLAAEIKTGHESTAWCNLAVASQRAGGDYSRDEAMAVREGFKPWGELVELIEKHLTKNGINPQKSKFELGPAVEFDATKQQFVGAGAEKANKYLTREYRKGFEVPDMA